MMKCMLFIHKILKEDKDSMISTVFKALKEDSRRGDFVHLTTKEKVDLDIDLSNDEIESMSQWMWKRFLNNKIKFAAFQNLTKENSKKEKTMGHFISCDNYEDRLVIGSFLEKRNKEDTGDN